MKIVSIGPAFPLRGGIADFNERCTQEFLKCGHDAEIISYSLQYPSFLFPGKTQYRTGEPPENLFISSLLNSISPFSWFRVAKKIKRQKPDILCVHIWMPFFVPALATICAQVKKNKHTKIVAICHNFIPHEPRFGDKFLMSRFLKHIDMCVAMSESVMQDARAISPHIKVVQTPHPLYDTFGELVPRAQACEFLQIDESKQYILFFGLVRAYKGLDLLIDACALMKTESVHVIVAGEFYDSPHIYLERIAKHGLQHKVIVKNEFISHEQVRYYFSAADIIAQTYHTATQSGITQIAYHFEKPMLVTNVGGLSEIVPHNKVGYVCDKNPQKIADALDDFFSNNRAESFSEAVRQYKKQFAWDVFCSRILDE
ncbi:MAG: glycosyltransferase [Bacteroidales bacterium]|nr:glycosyltransferase [Bacteroidales bacterium]NLK80592.1 glycosyltransferase [Bacteroidales bacterium]HPY82088.1 glycosyltransferase [Bacteroidales bacterium]